MDFISISKSSPNVHKNSSFNNKWLSFYQKKKWKYFNNNGLKLNVLIDIYI
jgi:hypothetical protein